MPALLVDGALLLLCLGVALIGVTLIQHLFLTVPFIPTPAATVEAMLDAADLRGAETVYDLGAGDARLLIAAKRRHPGITAKGCECVWAVWLLGNLRVWRSGQRVTLLRRSVYGMDVRDADVVFLYLFPSMMGRLAAKFDRELRPGTRVVSHAFRFPGREDGRRIDAGGKTLWAYSW